MCVTKKAGLRLLNTRILHKLTPEHFKLPDDAKGKVQYLCQQRRAVLIELKGAANSDGTDVKLAVQTIADALGIHRATVFRRLDDLKALGLLVDEGLLGYNKPRRRHLDLRRAQQLLGIVAEKPDRPEGLPDCVDMGLWGQIMNMPYFSEMETTGWNYLVAGLRHQFHIFDSRDAAERFIDALLRFTLAIEELPDDWRNYEMRECRVEGCPACGMEYFHQEGNEDDAAFAAKWQREGLPGDRVVSTADMDQRTGGSVVTAERTLKPLRCRAA